MSDLFNREMVLNVGGVRIASRLQDGEINDIDDILQVNFGVAKSVKKDPNTCDLQIFNLNKQSRSILQQRKLEVILEAGYRGNTSIIFQGSLEYGATTRNGNDWITTVQSSDGADKIKTKRINKSLKGPAKARDVLRVAAQALGLKPGNLKKAIKRGSVRGNLSEFTNGIVLSGKADKVLDSVCKSMGYYYTIQDGQLILLTEKNFLGTTAVLLTPDTGMIGSPEPGEDGYINVRALIQPNLLPAHRVQVKSREVDGFYRIERTDFTGSTRGGDWYADLECRPLGGSS